MSKPPFKFEEKRNSVFYHDLRIYIYGADVTPWITGSVTLQRVDRDGINMLTFSLANTYRSFDMTKENLDEFKFRLTEPYGPGGMYSEKAKYTIYQLKNSPELQVQHEIKSFGPDAGERVIGSSLKTIEGKNDENQATPDFTVRYPFSLGALVFHKYDPVRLFVKNPLTRSNNQWTCEFTGYLDVKPYTQDYVSGNSVINITCQDIRALMQIMRTQTNPMSQVGNENTLFFGYSPGGRVKNTGDAGFFNDLIVNFDRKSHILAGKSFKQSIDTLLFGVNQAGGISGKVGKLKKGKTIYYDPNDEAGRKQVLEEWNNIIHFGADPLPTAKDLDPVPPAGSEKEQKEIDATSSAGTMTARDGFLTLADMMKLGQNTVPNKEGSPDAARVHFLWPAEGAPLTNLVEYSIVDAKGLACRVEWTTRLELLNQVCKTIDYQMYVTGLGDIVFEFPMYDFLPADYNEHYASIYSFKDHIVSDNINDEGGNMISGLEVSSTHLIEQLKPSTATQEQTKIGTNLERKKTIFSNALASRIGVIIEPHTIPGVIDPNRLAQYGYIEFNKRLANSNLLDLVASYRPFLGLNRPIYHVRKSRMGITNNITYTWNIRQEATAEMALSYVRKVEGTGDDLKFRFITGGQRQPISYKSIFSGVRLKSDVNHTDEAKDPADEKTKNTTTTGAQAAGNSDN